MRLNRVPLRPRLYGPAVIAGAALLAAACGSSGSGAGGGHSAVKSGGTITVALDEGITGFNPVRDGDAEFVLGEIERQLLPEVWITQPDLSLKLNTDLVTSARVTRTSPQTVVYRINPKATWSDGVPITAKDFIYNWEANSGNPKYKDVGGKPYLTASTVGYSDIKSVTGSNGGKTVTVVFSKPYGDWKLMFGPAEEILPAHIAEKVGFNDGFQKFGPAVQVSGGPYMIQSYSPGSSLVEVRNPKWWGAPGKLNKIIFRFITDDSAIPPAADNGEVNIVNPLAASVPFLDSMKKVPNYTIDVINGMEFQHLDFNEANPYLAQQAVRLAIAHGTNRQQMIRRLIAPVDPHIGVLNNHFFMPIQQQYADNSNGNGTYDPAVAKKLLQSAGMTMGSDDYFHPNSGPEKGQDLTFSISTTTGSPLRAQLEELFQADMKNIGIKINIKNYNANTLFGTIGPKSEFDIIEFAWVMGPFASGNQSIYCSYTDSVDCGENLDHYADKQFDTLMTQAIGTIDPTQAAKAYNQADAVLWKDMATLPLFQDPELWAWSSNYANIVPNPSSMGITWNKQDWGVKAR